MIINKRKEKDTTKLCLSLNNMHTFLAFLFEEFRYASDTELSFLVKFFHILDNLCIAIVAVEFGCVTNYIYVFIIRKKKNFTLLLKCKRG